MVIAAKASAQLSVKVSPPKSTGSRTVVKVELRNLFTEKIQSARASVFLTDNSGKMLGQTAQWVIGGSAERGALAPAGQTVFNFVIPTSRPPSTAPTIKVMVSQIVLEGGKSVDPAKNAQIELVDK